MHQKTKLQSNHEYAYANADKLEKYVEERIKEISQQKDVLEKIVSGVNLDLKSAATPYKEELESINLRIKDTKLRIENLLESLGNFGKAATQTVESEIEKLQKNLSDFGKGKAN